MIGEYIKCLIMLSAYSSKLHRKELIKRKEKDTVVWRYIAVMVVLGVVK